VGHGSSFHSRRAGVEGKDPDNQASLNPANQAVKQPFLNRVQRSSRRLPVSRQSGYPAEFRRKVLDLVEAGRPIAEVAQALGISAQSIYTWRRQDRIDRGLLPGLSSPEKTPTGRPGPSKSAC
jgi:hypothetical protein